MQKYGEEGAWERAQAVLDFVEATGFLPPNLKSSCDAGMGLKRLDTPAIPPLIDEVNNPAKITMGRLVCLMAHSTTDETQTQLTLETEVQQLNCEGAVTSLQQNFPLRTYALTKKPCVPSNMMITGFGTTNVAGADKDLTHAHDFAGSTCYSSTEQIHEPADKPGKRAKNGRASSNEETKEGSEEDVELDTTIRIRGKKAGGRSANWMTSTAYLRHPKQSKMQGSGGPYTPLPMPQRQPQITPHHALDGVNHAQSAAYQYPYPAAGVSAQQDSNFHQTSGFPQGQPTQFAQTSPYPGQAAYSHPGLYAQAGPFQSTHQGTCGPQALHGGQESTFLQASDEKQGSIETPFVGAESYMLPQTYDQFSSMELYSTPYVDAMYQAATQPDFRQQNRSSSSLWADTPVGSSLESLGYHTNVDISFTLET